MTQISARSATPAPAVSPTADPVVNRFETSELALRRQPGVHIPRWCSAVTSSPIEMLVLGQLAYWFGPSKKTHKPRATIKRGGVLWVAKTHARLGRECGLSTCRVAVALRRLARDGVVLTRKGVASYNTRWLYRLNTDEILRLIDAAEEAAHAAEIECGGD